MEFSCWRAPCPNSVSIAAASELIDLACADHQAMSVAVRILSALTTVIRQEADGTPPGT